jgi:proteic killer suppression protein
VKYEVDLSRAKKDIRRAPTYIVDALRSWVAEVEEEGLPAVRKLPGYHDEPLRGKRKGERSVRLSKKWRAIYVETEDGEVVIVEVTEVMPHAY